MCAEMDLFAFEKLKEPKRATVGVRPLGEGEQPILEATAGHLTVVGAAGNPSVAVPVQSVDPPVEPTHVEGSHPASLGSIQILEEGAENLKRKAEAGSSGTTTKRRRHIIADDESSAESERVIGGAGKDIAEDSPPR